MFRTWKALGRLVTAWKALQKTFKLLGTSWNALVRLVSPYHGLEYPCNAFKYKECFVNALGTPVQCIGTP